MLLGNDETLALIYSLLFEAKSDVQRKRQENEAWAETRRHVADGKVLNHDDARTWYDERIKCLKDEEAISLIEVFFKRLMGILSAVSETAVQNLFSALTTRALGLELAVLIGSMLLGVGKIVLDDKPLPANDPAAEEVKANRLRDTCNFKDGWRPDRTPRNGWEGVDYGNIIAAYIVSKREGAFIGHHIILDGRTAGELTIRVWLVEHQ